MRTDTAGNPIIDVPAYCGNCGGSTDTGGLCMVRCQEQKCQQKTGCNNDATEQMFWPGSPPTFVCDAHAAAGRKIAAAMGCYVHFEPVVSDDPRG